MPRFSTVPVHFEIGQPSCHVTFETSEYSVLGIGVEYRAVPTNLTQILDALEGLYGPQKLAGPKDPYEMIVFLNCGYPASDVKCAKGFEALKREVGFEAKKILAAPKAKLAKVMRPSVIIPSVCAEQLKEIAGKVRDEFKGDLTCGTESTFAGGQGAGKGSQGREEGAPGIPCDWGAQRGKDSLVLRFGARCGGAVGFCGCARTAFSGEPGKNYAADYKAPREILDSGLAQTFKARQRAYLLLKKHGQETCKRSKPKCEACPLAAQCAYLQGKAADANTETE